MRRVSVALRVSPEIETLSAILLLSIGNSTQSDCPQLNNILLFALLKRNLLALHIFLLLLSNDFNIITLNIKT